MTVIDPQTWRDAEDGRALRELREALPDGWTASLRLVPPGVVWLWDPNNPTKTARMEEMSRGEASGPTIAAACDAAREALAKR